MENNQPNPLAQQNSPINSAPTNNPLVLGVVLGVVIGGLIAGGVGYYVGRQSMTITAPPLMDDQDTTPSAGMSPSSEPLSSASPAVEGKARMLPFASKNYPYRLFYPSHFDPPQIPTAETGQNSVNEQVVFQAQQPASAVRSFTINVAPGKADGLYLDTEATDTTKIGANVFNYFSLPEGASDGPATNKPLPMIAFEIEKEAIVYDIAFFGVSENDDPFVQMVMGSFEFTR